MELYEFFTPELTVRHQRTDAPKLDQFRMHTHDFVEIYLFLSGNGIFHVEGNTSPLHPGDILLMDRAESHYVDLSASVPYERMYVHFPERLLSPLDPGGALLSPLKDREPGTGNLYRNDAARDCLERMLRPDSCCATILAGLILFLQEICLDFSAGAQQPP